MKISDLKKSFGDFTLSVDALAIKEGHRYGLIGPNGCGKSTLIKLIAGVLVPDGGKIDYQGLAPRDITMLPRKPYMMHDSVYNNLVYPLKLRKIKPDEAMIDDWLEQMGLADKRRAYAPGLSGGQQQKLAFARALIFSPKLVLLDEGMSNMDLESLAQVQQIIQEQQQITWLIVSHQLPHIEQLCDTVYYMQDGQIAAQGACKEMLRHPAHEGLRRFLQFEFVRFEEDGTWNF